MAQEQDVLSPEFRKKVIDEILGNENKQRKAESLKRFEIYRERQRDYIIKKLQEEFSSNTVQDMRKITSINLTKRIVNEEASIYREAPTRNFSNLTDSQKQLVDLHYELSQADVKFKKANRFFKLLNQCAIQVIPTDGIIDFRVYSTHQYDVIPREDNPEKPLAYIVNTFDKSEFLQPQSTSGDEVSSRDEVNQKIADNDDYKRTLMRFVWWTDNYNFITNGLGEIIIKSEDETPNLTNPIGELPFIDIANDKDYEFWVRHGNGVVDFTIDFGVMLSDNATINRNQGFAQAVFKSREKPQSITIGPNHVLWLKKNGDEATDEEFEFVNPNPDLQASIDLLETQLKLFLTSRGVDPNVITGKGEGRKFSSGIERLLALIEKFEASQDDIDLFKVIEQRAYRLLVKWNNIYQGTEFLKDEVKLGTLPEDSKLDVKFAGPKMIQTKSEKEDSAIKLKKESLKDDIEIIMDLEEVDEEQAKEIWLKRKIREAEMKKMLEDELKKLGLEPQTPPKPQENGDLKANENVDQNEGGDADIEPPKASA